MRRGGWGRYSWEPHRDSRRWPAVGGKSFAEDNSPEGGAGAFACLFVPAQHLPGRRKRLPHQSGLEFEVFSRPFAPRVLALVVWLATAVWAQPTLPEIARRYARVDLPATPVSKELQNAKIDAALFAPALVSKDLLVPVEILAENRPRALESIAGAVRAAGGNVTGILQNSVLARVPRSAIAGIAARSEVHSVAAQPVFSPMQDAPLSKGLDVVRATHVEPLHRQGIRGSGVRVGILDFGFRNYRRWQSTGRLPVPKSARAFNDAGSLDGTGEGDAHGTACAEIIHDLAPDAELYLAAADGSLDQFTRAVGWLVAQRVEIISFAGGMSAGPHNGRSGMDWLVNQAVEKYHVLWVNSSGNQATAHWTGDAANRDRDGWIQFGADTGKRLFLQSDRRNVNINVLWDDWDSTNPRTRPAVDAYLFRLDPKTGQAEPNQKLIFHRDTQPMAHFELDEPVGQTWILALQASGVNRPLRVHVFVHGGHVYPSVAERSLSIPATAAHSLTVGAVDIRTGAVEEFSSRGPTDDGREKPDLSAFDDIGSLVYETGFSGTSAAAAGVAGVGALVRQERPDLSGLALRSELLRFVRAPASRNSGYGRGILDAASLPTQVVAGAKEVLADGRSGGLPQTDGLVRLPAALGGPVPPAVLDYLLANAPAFRAFQAAVAVNKPGDVPAYQTGESLVAAYRCTTPCYYAILRAGAGGSYQVLQSGEEPLDPSRSYSFPREGEPAAIGGSPGREDYILIAASERLEPGKLEPGSVEDLAGILSISVAGVEWRQ